MTALEKNWRDSAFRPLTKILWKTGITANQITITSFILLIAPIFMHFKNFSLAWQIIILSLIGIADAIDGPMARNNNNVTILGTWLDHLRDGSLVAWVSYLIYHYKLLSLEIISVIWFLQIILIWIIMKDFIIRYLKTASIEQNNFLSGFTSENLEASLVGRLQFLFWTLGYFLLMLYLILPNENLITVGRGLIIVEIIFAAMNIFDAYQKVAPATGQNISS